MAVGIGLAITVGFILVRPRSIEKPLELIAFTPSAAFGAKEAHFKMAGYKPSTYFSADGGDWKETLSVKVGDKWVTTNVVRTSVSMPGGTISILPPVDLPWKFDVAFSFRYVFRIGSFAIPLLTRRFHFVSEELKPVTKESAPLERQ